MSCAYCAPKSSTSTFSSAMLLSFFSDCRTATLISHSFRRCQRKTPEEFSPGGKAYYTVCIQVRLAARYRSLFTTAPKAGSRCRHNRQRKCWPPETALEFLLFRRRYIDHVERQSPTVDALLTVAKCKAAFLPN